MMINISNLNSKIDELQKNIDDYETKIYDTLSSVKNMSFYWSSGYTTSFFNKINDEYQNINELIDNLHKVLELMISLSNFYTSLSEDISSKLGLSNKIVNTNDLRINSNDDERTIELKRSFINSINAKENDVAYLISRIKVKSIPKIDFDSLEKNYAESDFLGMKDEMNDQIKILDMKKDLSSKSSIILIKSLSTSVNDYHSSNSGRINKVLNEIIESINSDNININEAYIYIINTKKKIKSFVDEAINYAKSIKVDKSNLDN